MSRGDTVALPTGRERWRIAQADTLTALPELPDASIDAVVTDPPYGISFQQQAWDGRDIHHAALASSTERRVSKGRTFEHWTTMWATELARVLKPGGHLVAFAAPRMSHRLTSGLEDAGLEIRDVLMWLHGQGMPKSRRLPGGLGTALKPAYEPIILARRPLTAPAEHNIRHHRTGALNIDACRLSDHPGDDAGDEAQPRAPRREGRWPANVTLSHAPACRPTRCARSCPVRRLDESHRAAPRPRGVRRAQPLLLLRQGVAP